MGMGKLTGPCIIGVYNKRMDVEYSMFDKDMGTLSFSATTMWD